MPLPSDDAIFQWQYSFVKDELFDDGRHPRAITLAGEHWAVPQLMWANPPNRESGFGCWWYPQDLAAAPVPNAVAVLSVAARLGAVPVLARHVIGEASEVRLLREVDVSVPVGIDALTQARAALVKRELMGLLRADGAAIEDALMACKEAIDGAVGEMTGVSLLPISLGVTEFPYIGAPGSRSKPQTYPVAIFQAPVGATQGMPRRG